MPRPKYRITDEDLQFARCYLSALLRNYELDFGSHGEKAENDFWTAIEQKRGKKQADSLNAWCEAWLSSDEWVTFKAAIRKRRERWKSKQTTVTLSEGAFKLLRRVAKRDKITYSEAVELYFGRALASNRGPRKTSTKRRSP